ncbi:MAG TPA: hypothetical protein VMT94_02790 [Burkholderiales bacterium]|nr:hypothetical protein [Burkholderiales bacterium]
MQSAPSVKNTLISAKVKEVTIPPVRDALVLGRDSPIGCVALRKALDLVTTTQFEHIEPDDDVIGDIIVRKALLMRVPQDTLVTFVLTHIKPLMHSNEILHLDLAIELQIEGKLV